MKQRIMALLLSAALVLSLSAAALATGESGGEPDDAETITTPQETPVDGGEGEETSEPDAVPSGDEASDPASEDAEAAENEEAAEGEEEASDPEQESAGVPLDPVTGEEMMEATDDMILFGDLEDLVRENNMTYKSLSASISDLDDLEDAMDDLEDTLDDLKDLEKLLKDNPDLEGSELAGGKTLADVQQAQGELRGTLSSMGSAGDPAVLERQMKDGRNQLVLGAQTLFIALVGMERQEEALVRQLKALDRTVEEMNLRYQMGQISRLQLLEVQNGRAALASGLTTLRMNLKTYKMQLEQMVGRDMTGTSPLGSLPAVTDEELAALDVEKDLKKVIQKNYSVYAADKAEENASDSSMAAYYSYKAACQQAELKFRTLYAKLLDCRQIVTAAETALECETLACQAAELKYRQGTISRNALLAAEDEMKTAQETLWTAKNDLFATYNNYCWAVGHGVLN